MEQKNTSLKKLTRAIVVVLLLVLLSLFFLLVGSWAGGVSAWVVAKVVDAPGVMLTALADRVLPAENNAVNALSRHLEAYGVRLHLSLVVPYLLVLIALAFSNPLERYKNFVKSLQDLVCVCKRFVLGEKSWSKLMLSYLKVGIYICICTLIPCFLLGSGDPNGFPNSNLAYVITDSVQHLLPVQLAVNFENAKLGEDGHLTDQGVTLEPVRYTALKTIMNTLARCATPDNGVTIELYGFASEDPFRDLKRKKSKKLNVKVANLRAIAVYKALVAMSADMSVEGVEIKKPQRWTNFHEMECQRNAMIQVPTSSSRDAFADRVVVLYLTSSGNCMVAQHMRSCTN